MAEKKNVVTILCPNCRAESYTPWAVELGYHAVRCTGCDLIYVNPRPADDQIDAAVRTGSHGDDAGGLYVAARRLDGRVASYQRTLGSLFSDVWAGNRPITWLDIGAGYGEIVEAIERLAPKGSAIKGLEPMKPKASSARARGLNIEEDYLRPTHPKVDYVSIVDVFSHVPDFDALLADVRAVLNPGGEVFIETGNLADLKDRSEFPNELGLPDHLVFAGERQLLAYLERAQLEVVKIERVRFDGLVNFAKSIVKKVLGRPVVIGIPYTSRYRQLLVRARLSSPV